MIRGTFCGAVALVMIPIASVGSTEISGEVIRWEESLGALHLKVEDGEEVVVPVVGHTQILADYADYSSGDLFEEGERVRVSRPDDGPLRVEVRPTSTDDEPVAEKIRDEMEESPEVGEVVPPSQPTPPPSPTPRASPATTSAPTPAEMPTATPAVTPATAASSQEGASDAEGDEIEDAGVDYPATDGEAVIESDSRGASESE